MILKNEKKKNRPQENVGQPIRRSTAKRKLETLKAEEDSNEVYLYGSDFDEKGNPGRYYPRGIKQVPASNRMPSAE